ncbi:MAG: hypothetical protein BEN18_01160 [Epulopiscium sp. Nuni2H_MBin001]|nr:MAG: hypothetical protein BEN18_01160 [Epulopiscium sp. Nuni2H_MBin001]
MKKLALFLSIAALTGCSSSEVLQTEATTGVTTITIGATPTPAGEILEYVKPLLLEQGIYLEIKEFTDYILPNIAVEEGDLDANFFQHIPYLTDFNENNGTDIVPVGKVLFAPLGIYPGKSTELEELKKGGVEIAIPNDTTNEARALALLEQLGIIEIDSSAGLSATPKDIISNPYDVSFIEIEAAQVPRIIQDVDFGVITGNYALDGGFTDLVLATEDSQSEFAILYGNVVATHSSNADNEAIKTLVDILQSQVTIDFINDTYNGAVLSVID